MTTKFTRHLSILLTAMIPCLCSAEKEEETEAPNDSYTVENFNGVPFIAKNGKPVRGRMFFGGYPGGNRYTVENDSWSDISIKFTSPHSGLISVRFLFETLAKDVYAKHIRLVSLEDGNVQTLYDTSKENKDAALFADKKQLCSISNEDGLLHIVKPNSPENGKINFYLSNLKVEKCKKYALELSLKYDKRGYFDAALFRDGIIGTENRMFTRQQKLAAQNGVDIVLCGMPLFWREEDRTATEKWYADFFADLKRTNPKARIIPRIDVNAPNWWVEAHPESEIRYEDGKGVSRIVRDGSNSVERNASISSKEWQKDAAAALEKTVSFLEKNYGKYFMGYHICGGGTGEWAYIEATKWPPSGYDAQTLSAWRTWLKKKYVSDENLRASWHRNDVSLDTAAVPSVKEREAVPELLDPEKNRNIMDFALFLNDEITDAMLFFAQTTKKAAPNKLLLLFYGYGFELSGCKSPCMPAVQGHFATEKLLNSPYVDGLCGPMSYNKRALGGYAMEMGPSESILLRNKLWIDEDDNRTYLIWGSGSPLLGADENQQTIDDSIKVLRRNLAHQLIRNHPSWWMDLFGAGWYNCEKLWQQVKLFKKAEIDIMKNPLPFTPEVGVVYDDASMCAIGSHSYATSCRLLYLFRPDLSASGVPYGQYLLGDILAGKAAPKLTFMNAIFALDGKQRKILRDFAKKSVCVWGWAPGYIDLDAGKFSADAVRETCGFSVVPAGDVYPQAAPTEEGKKAGIVPFGQTAVKLSILFSPVPEKGDVVLAKYTNGLPCVVYRPARGGNRPEIFCGTPRVPYELIKFAEKIADVHVYADNRASVIANGAYLSVSATEDGLVTLDVKSNKPVLDIATKKKIGNGPILKLEMKKGDTKFLRIGKGNSDLKKADK